MKKKRKRIKKEKPLGYELEKRARNLFETSASNLAAKSPPNKLVQKEINEELWQATIEFVKHMKRDKIRPLFS